MKDFVVFNETFNINKTSTYSLAVQFSYSGYSYSVTDAIRGRYVALKHVNFKEQLDEEQFLKQLKKIIKSDAFLNKSYKSVGFMFVSSKSVLVPDEVFDKNHLSEYLKFVHPLNQYEELHYNHVKSLNTFNVFSIPSHLTTLLVNQFPQIEFFHQSSLMLSSLSKLSLVNKNLFSIHVNSTFAYISIFKEKVLHYHNPIKYQTDTDLLYHILNLMKQMQINPKHIPVFMSGFVEKNDNLYKLLHNYLADISFLDLPKESPFNYGFDDVAPHLFINLLSIT